PIEIVPKKYYTIAICSILSVAMGILDEELNRCGVYGYVVFTNEYNTLKTCPKPFFIMPAGLLGGKYELFACMMQLNASIPSAQQRGSTTPPKEEMQMQLQRRSAWSISHFATGRQHLLLLLMPNQIRYSLATNLFTVITRLGPPRFHS
ncbi:96_t:CDS:2, partial [Ambispora leptoticha]